MSWVAGQVTLAEPVTSTPARQEAARSGDPATAPTAEAAVDELEQVVRTHARFVFQVAYSVLRNREDAEDAVQETYLRLLRQDLTKIEEPRLWLARVAWRVAVDRIRKRHELPLDEATAQVEQVTESAAAADEVVIESQLKQLLERLIERLPRDLRDIVRLSTVQEMNSRDIAGVLGISEVAVRGRLFRARQMLREKMLLEMEKKS